MSLTMNEPPKLALLQINYKNQRESPTAEGNSHCLPLPIEFDHGTHTSWARRQQSRLVFWDGRRLHCGGLMFQSQRDWPAWALIWAVVPI